MIKKENVAMSLSLIVIGILLCIFKSDTVHFAFTIAGIILIGYGIFDVFKKNTQGGIIKIVSGAVLVLFGWLLIVVALILVGVFFTIIGIMDFSHLNDTLSRCHSLGEKMLNFFLTVVKMTLGLLLIINSFFALDIIFIIIGAVLILDGIGYLFEKSNEVKVVRSERL